MAKSKSTATVFTVFPTAWGAMGAAAGDAGLSRVILPHYQRDDLLALMQWNHPNAKRDDAYFEGFAAACRNYFNGQAADFSNVLCDLPSAESFSGKVYRVVREILWGRTMSYREVSLAIGSEQAARAVATTMSKNSLPLIVPCHRVIYSNGGAGGFSAEGGEALKLRLIAHEKKRG